MATILDVGLLSFFMPFFIFFFVFVLIYALLSKTNLFGEKQAVLNFVGSICIAAISVFTGTITGVVINIVPWIILVIIVLLFLFSLFTFFGISKNEEIWATIGGQTVVYVIILIIVLVGLIQAFEKQVSPYQSGTTASATTTTNAGIQPSNVKGAVISTLTHPRLLGALFILIVSALSIKVILDKT